LRSSGFGGAGEGAGRAANDNNNNTNTNNNNKLGAGPSRLGRQFKQNPRAAPGPAWFGLCLHSA
jgi:hypothetical protein